MSGHYRKAYREAIAAAVLADPAFAGFRRETAWAQQIDPSQLPIFGVATPGESCAESSVSTVHRRTTVQVALKIAASATVEDDLDDLSLALEVCVLDALGPLCPIVALTSTSTSIDAGGRQRAGVLVMEFTALRFTGAGSQN